MPLKRIGIQKDPESYNECSIFPLKSLISIGKNTFVLQICYIHYRRVVGDSFSVVQLQGQHCTQEGLVRGTSMKRPFLQHPSNKNQDFPVKRLLSLGIIRLVYMKFLIFFEGYCTMLALKKALKRKQMRTVDSTYFPGQNNKDLNP